ncbi:autotransporter assembly complex protein TamB [Vibrio sp. WXL103]|uniref:autotransporter assembly complex protein TamB n=1 Tax=Vibrio sp. WXL103 TaxID=3450710 RepID=UPI003EC6EEBD
MIRYALGFTKWLTLSLFTLVALIAATLSWTIFTNSGLNLVLWGAEKALPQLQVGRTEGALFPKFTLYDVAFNAPELGVDLDAKQVTLAINHRCFFTPKVCVDEISVNELSLMLMPVESTDVSDDEQTPPVRSIATPVPIELSKLALTNIKLDVYGTQIGWQELTTAASFIDDTLTLSPTALRDSYLQLAPVDSESTVPEPSAAGPSQSEPITLPEVWIPLDVVIEQIDIENFTLRQETPFVLHHLGLAGRAGGHRVGIDRLAIDIDDVNAALAAKVDLTGDYPLEARLTAEIKHAIAKGEQLSLDLSGSVANLALQLSVEGVNKLDLTGQLQPLQASLPFSVKLSDSSVQWPLVGEKDYGVVVTHLQGEGSLDGYQVDLTGSVVGAGIPDLDVELEGQGDLEQISLSQLKIGALGGHLQGQVASRWSQQVTWQADVTLDSVQPGLYWPQAEGNLSGRIVTSGGLTEPGGWYVELPTLDVRGIFRDYPLDLAGNLSASDRQGSGEYQLETDGILLAHGPNEVAIEGRVDETWQMDLTVQLPDFAQSLPELSGSANGKVRLRGDLEQPEVRLNLRARDVQWQQQAQLERLNVRGSVVPAKDPRVSLSVAANRLRFEDYNAAALAVELDGSLTDHVLDVNLDSDLVDLSLSLAGDYRQQANTWQGALNTVKVTTEQGIWRTQQAIEIDVDIDASQAQVGAHCWQQAQASVCLDQDAQVSPQQGGLALSINQFDFEQIKQFVPEQTQVEGLIDANLNAEWQGSETLPQVRLNVVLAPGAVTQQLDQPLKVAWNQSTLAATFADNRVEGQWRFDFKDNGELTGELVIPDVTVEDRQIDAQLRLSPFNLDFMAPLVGAYSELDGRISADIALSGPLMQPRAQGFVTIEQLLLRGEITPLDIDQGKISLDLNGYQADLNALIKTPEGDLNIKGDADWQDLADWRGDVRVFADGLLVDIPPMVKVRVVPDMTISMSPKQAKVTGDIRLPWARIDVQSLPESAIGISKDQVILGDDLQPIEEDDPIPFALETDVKIHIGNDFRLSAFGLDGSLVGSLNVAQRERGPIVSGEVNILNGQYRSFGQDLLIDEGKILMNGPVDQPYIVITAIRNPDNTQDDVVAGIRVTGPADEPEVEIFSEPAMPQANALSYLLRGQDIDAESGGNAITTTLIGLSLARSGKVVGEIGEAFGVQDLQLDTAGSGDDSQVTVSGYILPGLQVKYGVGIFDSVGEFTVRYRLMKDLYLEVVSGLDSAVDLLYQFEFD